MNNKKEVFLILERCYWSKNIHESFVIIGKKRIEHYIFDN